MRKPAGVRYAEYKAYTGNKRGLESMDKIKMALAGDTLSDRCRMLEILKQYTEVTVINGQDSPGARALVDRQDVLLFTVRQVEYLKQCAPLIRFADRAGVSVICIAKDESETSLRRYAPGVSVIHLVDQSDPRGSAMMEKELLVKVKSSYKRSERQERKADEEVSPYLIGIGASTGGPKALPVVLGELPTNIGAIIIAQHLSSGFSERFAQYLNQRCRMEVRLASPGEVLRRGRVYIAPEGLQPTVGISKNEYILQLTPDRHQFEFCPSVDGLFMSIAEHAAADAMGIVLTGMGDDGSRGLLKMKKAGAYTISQDEETSDIYSMPREAALLGGTAKQVPLGEMAGEIEQFDRRMNTYRRNQNGTGNFSCG